MGNIVFIIISIISILQHFPTAFNHSLKNISSLNYTYVITRTIQFGNYIQQTDALFIFVWSFAILAYISLALYGINYILNKLFNFENKNFLTLPISSIILGFCLLINNINFIKFLINSAVLALSRAQL